MAENDALGACRIRAADDRANVTRVLDAVQHDHEAVRLGEDAFYALPLFAHNRKHRLWGIRAAALGNDRR
ncbi:hypothetical protein D3C80_2182610 [compost metagenome]